MGEADAYLELSSSDDSSEEITTTLLAVRRVGTDNADESVSELLAGSLDDFGHLFSSSERRIGEDTSPVFATPGEVGGSGLESS